MSKHSEAISRYYSGIASDYTININYRELKIGFDLQPIMTNYLPKFNSQQEIYTFLYQQ